MLGWIDVASVANPDGAFDDCTAGAADLTLYARTIMAKISPFFS
jgi:hypothetical protein